MKDYRVKPNERVNLADHDPRGGDDFDSFKDKGENRLEELNRELEQLQELLYAEHRHRVLVVLQGMDTSGKDGVIRHVFEGVNPQGVRVANFKAPTAEELDHDYLWRVHKQTPAKGELVIFNRSHYEDVLVVRVHNLVPESVWQKRYDQICAFERTLADEGTVILKFFLHIDLAEQKQRFEDRLSDPTKRWKYNPRDLDERKRWHDYTKAYEDMLEKTSTAYAPWFIVPSNRKWARNLVIANVLVDTLKGLKMEYPALNGDLAEMQRALAAA